MKRAAPALAERSQAVDFPLVQGRPSQAASQAPYLHSVPAKPLGTTQSDVFAAAKKGDAGALFGMMATGLINPSAIDPATGMTALMLAALRGHTDVVTILTRGSLAAHINLQDARSNTALSLAEAAGHAAVVEILRARGAGGDGLIAGALTASEPVLAASATVISPGGAPVSQVITTNASAATSAFTAPQSTQADMRPMTESLFDAIERNDPDALREVLTQVAVQAATEAENILATIKSRRLTDIHMYCTPLMAAAWLGHAHMVETLMRAGAKPDQQNVDGQTAPMAAAHQGYTEIVQTLLQAGVEVDRTTLHDKDDCEIWLDYSVFGWVWSPRDDRYFLQSAHGGIVQRGQSGGEPIFYRGKPPWVADWTALMFAARNGHTETAQALLQGGASVDKTARDGASALLGAVEHGHTATAQVLLHAGAKVGQTTSDGTTALMHAANYGHTATLQMLLHAGATVDQATSKGWTALMCAATNGHTATVQALLQAGANVAHGISDGKTALMFAAENRDTPTVLALLEGGAGVEQTTAHGSTALMYAAQSGQTANVLALLQGGADVDHVSSDGFTALMYAADKGHTAAAQMLLWGNANYKFRSKNGTSALSLATTNEHWKIVKLLNDYGANSIFSFSNWFG